MPRSKYNVSSDKDVRTSNGIVFDSKLEMKFYEDIILPGIESGEIKEYEMQKEFVLQEGFEYGDIKVRPIKYVADFFIVYKDNAIETIDVKGMVKPEDRIKRKMMWFHFPFYNFKWVQYCKKYGGWIELDELNRKRAEAKRNKRSKQDGKD